MNIFDEALSVLKSKVQIRKLFQDMHAEDMQRVISRIEAIYEEKMSAQMEAQEEQARKREAVEAVLKQMQELGPLCRRYRPGYYRRCSTQRQASSAFCIHLRKCCW